MKLKSVLTVSLTLATASFGIVRPQAQPQDHQLQEAATPRAPQQAASLSELLELVEEAKLT